MYAKEQSTMLVKNLKFTFTVLDIRYITQNFPFGNKHDKGMTNESKLFPILGSSVTESA